METETDFAAKVFGFYVSEQKLKSLWLINKMHFINEKTLIAKAQKI